MVHHQIFLSVWDAESGNLVKTIKFEEEIQGTIKVKSRAETTIWTWLESWREKLGHFIDGNIINSVIAFPMNIEWTLRVRPFLADILVINVVIQPGRRKKFSKPDLKTFLDYRSWGQNKIKYPKFNLLLYFWMIFKSCSSNPTTDVFFATYDGNIYSVNLGNDLGAKTLKFQNCEKKFLQDLENAWIVHGLLVRI